MVCDDHSQGYKRVPCSNDNRITTYKVSKDHATPKNSDSPMRIGLMYGRKSGSLQLCTIIRILIIAHRAHAH